MIESKENIDDAVMLTKELLDDAQQEASKHDEHWKERIGIKYDWI